MAKVGEMSRFNLLLCLLVAVSVLSMVSANPRILAAVINCVANTPCDGTSGNDIMNGSVGIDNMNGLDGKDRMDGNAGADKMKGGPGSDNINGGDGSDFIDELLDTSKNVISGGGGDDSVNGGNADDTINGDADQDALRGYLGNDRIHGDIGSDVLQGLPGNDILDGGEGDDVLAGDQSVGDININFGADTLKGGPGDDKLFQSAAGVEPSQVPPITETSSDAHKDILDCGDGNDEAWGNVNTDHDEFKNCEVIHKE